MGINIHDIIEHNAVSRFVDTLLRSDDARKTPLFTKLLVAGAFEPSAEALADECVMAKDLAAHLK